MDKIIKDQFFQLLKNRKYDIDKFKLVNINNSNVFKLYYEQKFITYIETKDYNFLNMTSPQTKSWYSYRTNLLNYVNSIIKNGGMLETICIINVVDSFEILQKCLDSLSKQTKKVYVILIVNTMNEMKLAIKNNVEYFFTTEKNHMVKFSKGLGYVRGSIKTFKNILFANSNDIFLPNWVEEGSNIINKIGSEIVGRDLLYIFDLNSHNILERKINRQALDKITGFPLNEFYFFNGMMIKRAYLMKINWNLIDEKMPNMTASIFKQINSSCPKISSIKNSHIISCYSDKTPKSVIEEYIINEMNLIANIKELPFLTLDLSKEFDLAIKQKTNTKIVFASEKEKNDKNDKNNPKKIISKNFGILEPNNSDDNDKKEINVPTIIKNNNDKINKKQDKIADNGIQSIQSTSVQAPSSVQPPQIIRNHKEKENKKKTEIRVYPTNYLEESPIELDELLLNNIDLNQKDSNLLRNFRNEFINNSPRKVLAIIPVLGRHDILKICIRCIKEQSIKTDIILLVSTAEDVDFAKDCRHKYVTIDNYPLSMKFQKGIDYAKMLEANYIMFVGSDDLLTKGWVGECLALLDNYSFDVVGKNYHYIYDTVNNLRYIRRYVPDKLSINIPPGLRSVWCLGSGRLIKSNILERSEWRLFKRELNRGLDAESGLRLYKSGARFGLISTENFLSMRDDWDCITEMATILESPSNKLMKIKNFNPELNSFKESYIRIKLTNPKNKKNLVVECQERVIPKEIISYAPENMLGKKILIINGFNNDETKYNMSLYEKIIKLSPNFEFVYSNRLGKKNLQAAMNDCFIGLLLKEDREMTKEDTQLIIDLGIEGLPFINNSTIPNSVSWHDEEDIIAKIKMFTNYGGNKFYHKLIPFTSQDNSQNIFKFAKNMKFSKKITQLYLSNSLKSFKKILEDKYNFLREYHDTDSPAIFFGVYDKEHDKKALLDHNGIAVVIWGGSDIYHKAVNDKMFIDAMKNKNNLMHIAISKDVSDILSILKIPHIRNLFSFIKKSFFKPASLGNKIYIYCNENNSTYNGPIIDYLKTKLKNFEFLDSRAFNVKYDIMPAVYSKCFIGLRLTSFDGNANTCQELGLMGIKCIHNGDLPNCIKWSLNDLDNIIQTINEESKNIGKTNKLLSNEVNKYIEQQEKNYFIFYSDFYDFFQQFETQPTVSVILNTFGNDNDQLKRIIQMMLNQNNIDAMQIIISTVEGDKSIQLYNDNYKEDKRIDLCITTLAEHPGKGPKGIYYQLNKASTFIRNNWVSYFSGNDIIYVNKFQKEIETCMKNGKLICNSSFNMQKDGNIKKMNLPDKYNYKKHLVENFMSDCSLIHRSVFEKLMPFNLDYQNHAFWDFFLRCYETYGDIFTYCETPTWEYIITEDSAHVKRKNNPELQKINEEYKKIMLSQHQKALV